jgi:hypothetical protein
VFLFLSPAITADNTQTQPPLIWDTMLIFAHRDFIVLKARVNQKNAPLEHFLPTPVLKRLTSV